MSFSKEEIKGMLDDYVTETCLKIMLNEKSTLFDDVIKSI
jgi:hypothetical protein